MLGFIFVQCIAVLVLYVCKNRFLAYGTDDPFAATEQGMKLTVGRNVCLFAATAFGGIISVGVLWYVIWAPSGTSSAWFFTTYALCGIIMCFGFLAYVAVAIVLQREMKRLKRVEALNPHR